MGRNSAERQKIMKIDYSSIFGDETPKTNALKGPSEPRNGNGPSIYTPNGENAAQRTQQDEPAPAGKLARRADQQRAANEWCASILKEYQANIKLAEAGQARILEGVKTGEDFEALFLEAAQIVAALTGNRLFYQQIERDLRTRHEGNG